jgi:DNA-binding response OmpR family regulator
MREKILVVEDDPAILTGLVDLLDGEGYEVIRAEDGESALRLYREEKPLLILLDIMIPEKSGYDVCREIRSNDSVTPILMLTAKGQEVDKVVGLELGADDYIVKPFGVNELLARIRATLRRLKARRENRKEMEDSLSFGDVFIDLKTYQGRKGEEGITLSRREIELLRLFRQHAGEVINRTVILERVWGIHYEGTTRTLDQHIAKLRQKVEADPSRPKHILTVHGVGYRFCP